VNRELVIAAYDSYLDWLEEINSDIKVTVYRKGDEPTQISNEIKLEPNKGRCVHTFFNHIYNNYDNLADITFFAQDYPFDHWEDIIDVVNNNKEESRCQLKIGGYYGFHFNTIMIPSHKGGIMWNLIDSQHHGKGKVLSCRNMFFDSFNPSHYEFMPGGHFGITKEHAHLRSKEFYKKVVDFLLDKEIAPWIIERLECYIFNPNIK
jgi:hypothetical protein